MITLKEFIKIDSEAKAIRKKIEPENTRLGEIAHLKEEFNGNLTWDVKTFISQKLWDNMDSSTKEKVQAYRDELDKMLNPPKNELTWATTEDGGSHGSYSISAIQKGPFDPFYDEWWIVDCEQSGDKVRFEVSCKKNEDSISGLMAFLDAHWTTWFDASEIPA